MSTVSTHSHENHGHDPSHMHHFDSADHQFVATKQGVWIFMVTEILMFGGLFVAFAIYHSLYPDIFKEGASHLNWMMGGLNTIVLLLSSYTMANSIRQMQKGNTKACLINLWITIACACIFMVVKYFEYSHKFHLGILPGKYFHFEEAHVKNLALFFSFYFVMTGLHGVHVLVGIGMIYWMIRRVKRGYYNSHYYTGIEGVGLYWHIVDIVWIFLFPLVYLIG